MGKRNKSSIHDEFTNPERILADQSKIRQSKRINEQKDLENKNVKMAFHIHNQSASIDVKKQRNDFEHHQKLLQLHGKYKQNKVWGGAIGSVSYKGSPGKKMRESFRLPPLITNPVIAGSDRAADSIV